VKDNSIFKLYKNDFALAKANGDPKAVGLPYYGFIMQLPNETFCVKTNQQTDIVFVSIVKVELVDLCENIVKDISDNFAYRGFQDENGIKQIDFEFGKINDNFYTVPLFLKITDLTNFNVWYSSSFLITDYEKNYSTRFDYTSEENLEGFNYELSPLIQSIRISRCYYNDDADETTKGQYVTTANNIVNYLPSTVQYGQYICEQLNTNTKRGLESIFSHPTVYIDGELNAVKDAISKEPRAGDTNWFKGEFLANPQGEIYIPELQILTGLQLLSLELPNNSVTTIADIPSIFKMNFDKPIEILPTLAIKLYKNDTFVANGTPTANGQSVEIDFGAYTFENGVYKITVSDGIYWGLFTFDGIAIGDWMFTVTDGDYDDDDYDNNDYFTI